MNLPRYRLFILGAGFSAPAGLPLAAELLADVRRNVRDQFQVGAGWDGPLEPEIEEWKRLYPGQVLNLESVLGYSHRKHFLGLLGSDEYFAHGSRSIAAARSAIQQILTQATPAAPPTVYREFAERLRPNDVVLTFNYDTLLEQSLDDIGKPFTLTPEWWLANSGAARYVNVLKLHGSIDWYDRYYHDDAVQWHRDNGHDVPDRDPLFGPDPTIPTESLARGPIEVYGSRLLPRVFRVPDHRAHFPISEGYSPHLVPFVLPLAYDKLLGHEPILDLWENLHRTQDLFSAIVSIGYSMPRYDSYAYEALGKLIVDYQDGGDRTRWDQRRVPIQIVGLSGSAHEVLGAMPFLDAETTRVWHHGFTPESLAWTDWGD